MKQSLMWHRRSALPIVFQGLIWPEMGVSRPYYSFDLRMALLFFMVIRQISRSHGTKKLLILTGIWRNFRTVTPVWIDLWLWNDAQSLKWHKRDALLFFKVICSGLGFFRKKPISSGTPGKKWKKPISSSFVRTKLEETGKNCERCQKCWKKIIIILNFLQKIICIWLIGIV